MPVAKLPPKDVLARALRNDTKGVVSESDARKIVNAALADIAKSDKPENAFESNKRFIDAARALASADKDIPRLLESYVAKGQSAVHARLEQLNGGATLPTDVKAAFSEQLKWADLTSRDSVTIKNVTGNTTSGYQFKWQDADGKTGDGFAVKHDGDWFMADRKISKANLNKATDLFLEYFDAEIAPEMKNDWGSSAAEIKSARDAVRPTRAYFSGESDPHDLVSSYPFVLTFENATGSDHGYFLGFNPGTGESEAYAFN